MTGSIPRPGLPSTATILPSLSVMLGSTGGSRSGSRSDTSLRTAASSTMRITGALWETTKPVAQFHMRARGKPSWPTSRAASAVALRSTVMPSSGAVARKPPSGALTSTSADR